MTRKMAGSPRKPTTYLERPWPNVESTETLPWTDDIETQTHRLRTILAEAILQDSDELIEGWHQLESALPFARPWLTDSRDISRALSGKGVRGGMNPKAF